MLLTCSLANITPYTEVNFEKYQLFRQLPTYTETAMRILAKWGIMTFWPLLAGSKCSSGPHTCDRQQGILHESNSKQQK